MSQATRSAPAAPLAGSGQRIRRRPPHGRGALLLAAALLTTFAIAFTSLNPVLEGSQWWLVLTAGTAIQLGAAALLRLSRPRLLLPVLGSALALLLWLTVVSARDLAPFGILPTPEVFARFGALAELGATDIATRGAPIPATYGVLFVLCLGIGMLVVLAELLALSLGLRALAGLPVLSVLMIAPATGTGRSDWLIFALTAAGYLWLLRAGDPLRRTGTALGLGAGIVSCALVVPMLLPSVEVRFEVEERLAGLLTGINPVLNLGQDLRRTIPRTVLLYSSQSNTPHYLRLTSLQGFRGENWAPDQPDFSPANQLRPFPSPPGLSPDVPVREDFVAVQIENLASPWLPTPYPPNEVFGPGRGWYIDPQNLTIVSESGSAQGLQYTVSTIEVDPEPAVLLGAGQELPEGYEKFLALPSGIPAIITSTAERVAGPLPSAYAQAVALQDFFRGGAFQYSEQAPVQQGFDGSGMEALGLFLEARTGYCVHFASAMAVMARTLGIPSRVAVGFLPGESSGAQRDGKEVMRVTTSDLHAWPELYFEGAGWVRFEPTPGRGIVPAYAQIGEQGVPAPSISPESPLPTPSPSASTGLDPDADPESQGPGLGGLDAGVVLLAVGIALIALLLLLAPRLVRILLRFSRLARMRAGDTLARTAWRELVDTATDLGLAVPPAGTPRQLAAELSKGLPPEEQEALRGILAAVEAESFAEEETPSLTTAELCRVLRAMRRRRRAGPGAWLWPPSLRRWASRGQLLRP